MVQKLCLIASCLLLLVSCSPKTEPVEVISTPVEIQLQHPKSPEPIKLANIKWNVINHEDKIYYALSVSDYEVLALNMADIKRYIQAQINIINYYKAQ